MTVEELKDKGAIFFEKITDGLQEYAEVKLKLEGKKAQAHFKNLKKEYGADHAYADFYYYRLDDDAREMVDELLSEEEQKYLTLIAPVDVENDLIFPLDDKLLRIILKLNEEEMLFSTIYFLPDGKSGKPRTTWWGNYDHEYICFKDK